MAWVEGDAVLTFVGIASPSQEEEDWAATVAAAISAGFDHRLSDADVDGTEPELVAAALTAAGDAYKRRETPFGVTGYADLQGAAIRVARDPLEAVEPILRRYATPGIG